MYPVYVRGEAYLAAHQGKEAAAEFQKILDHRGIVLNEPIGALALFVSGAPMPCRATQQRQRLHIRISSRSGRTPILTSLS